MDVLTKISHKSVLLLASHTSHCSIQLPSCLVALIQEANLDDLPVRDTYVDMCIC
jgi:hypothetical protein